MRKYIILISILTSSVILKAQSDVQEPLYTQLENFTDTRDNQIYEVVQIGTQVWMAQNLNFDDGKSWCYSDSAKYCEKYGRLYTWESATKVCPSGWHLPSDEEWETLALYIAEQNDSVVKKDSDWGAINWQYMGLELKSKSGWHMNANGNNTYGFNGLAGGLRNFRDGSFISMNESGYWWSSTEAENKAYAYRRYLHYSFKHFGRYDVNKRLGHSVRCVRD